MEEHPWAPVYARYAERSGEPCTPVDMMIVATARLLRDRVLAGDYRTMLVGAGNSRTAGALCYCLLKKGGRTVTMVEGTGRIGHEPLPIPNAARLTATMLTGTLDAYGTLVGGNRPQCIALLGGGEIDLQGNLNSTLGGDRFLTGSGGSNDAASMAAETVVMMRQSARRMVPRARYVTTPGSRIQHLVSDLGVYGKDAQGLFELRQYFASPELATPANAITGLQEKCGWPLRTAPMLAAATPPDTEEMSLLRWLTSTA